MLMLPWFENIYQQMTTRLLQHRLHHGLLLCGQAGIGKYQLAQSLAKTLLCKKAGVTGFCNACQSCQLFDANTHPDYSELTSEKQLGVDKIREGIGRLNSTAQLSGNKVLIIPQADTMTESAANALLKTLEEPTDNTFLILITHQINRLLPTIVSRCEKHILTRPHREVAQAWLAEQGMYDVTPALIDAYAGAPLRVQQVIEENTGGLSYQQYQEGLDKLLSGTGDAVSLATAWQESAATVVDWLQQYAHQSYIHYNSPALYSLYQTCIHAHQALLNPGVNKIMILSCVLAEVKRPESHA